MLNQAVRRHYCSMCAPGPLGAAHLRSTSANALVATALPPTITAMVWLSFFVEIVDVESVAEPSEPGFHGLQKAIRIVGIARSTAYSHEFQGPLKVTPAPSVVFPFQ